MTVERFRRYSAMSTIFCAAGCGLVASCCFAQPQTPPVVNPQIVRVSYVEGDVRVSRGAGKDKGAAVWEQAAVDLPLETGYSLVTGKGRAEIEFEDASTVYVAENSVVSFSELSTIGEAPYTLLNLLSGTMTVKAHLRYMGDAFSVTTPSSGFVLHYPQELYARVDSYLDAMGLTPMEDSHLAMGVRLRDVPKDETRFYRGLMRLSGYEMPNAQASAEWDAWVRDRVADREDKMALAMKESGLTTPIAGLAEMSGAGTFFPCEYGTCWEPTNGWGGSKDAAQMATKPVAQRMTPAKRAGLMQVGYELPTREQTATPNGQYGLYVQPRLVEEDEDPFPCHPFTLRSWYARDPVTQKLKLVTSDMLPNLYPRFDWAVCHAGSWMHHGRRYAWVVGTHRHHHCPVHWVKNGGKVGYVPVHPKDVAGKTPENLKNGMFVPVDRKAGSVERVAYSANGSVKVLREAPREYRRADVMPLQRAEAPVMMAYALHDTLHNTLHNEIVGVHAADALKGVKGQEVVAKEAGTPIVFNAHKESFTIDRPVSDGGRMTHVAETFGGRVSGGSGIVGGGGRVSSAAGGGGYGGASGGSRSGSSSSYSGGSGASHASAPAASAPAASSPAPAASGGHK